MLQAGILRARRVWWANFGYVRPDETVDLYFNMSKDGQLDTRGPWNSEPNFKYIADPTPHGNEPAKVNKPSDERRTAKAATAGGWFFRSRYVAR